MWYEYSFQLKIFLVGPNKELNYILLCLPRRNLCI